MPRGAGLRRPLAVTGAAGLAIALFIATGITASPGRDGRPPQPVEVTNEQIPVTQQDTWEVDVEGLLNVAAEQEGSWTVGAAQDGAWSVEVEGTPTVRVAPPSRPFRGTAVSSNRTVGPGQDETLALTSITITNFTDEVEEVQLFEALVDGDPTTCSGEVSGTPDGAFFGGFLAPPQATTQVTYPTPLVLGANGGSGCVHVMLPSGVRALLVGFAG